MTDIKTARMAEAEGVDAIVKTGPILTALGELDAALGARTHPLLGRGSVHASLIEGGAEMSSYPGRCVLGLERRTLPGESVADIVACAQRTSGAALATGS